MYTCDRFNNPVLSVVSIYLRTPRIDRFAMIALLNSQALTARSCVYAETENVLLMCVIIYACMCSRDSRKRYKDFLSLILKFWVHQQENQTTHSSADGDNKTQAQSSSSSSSSSSTPSPSDRDVSIMQHVVNAGVDGRDCEAEINRVMLRLQSDPHFQGRCRYVPCS